MRDEVKLHNSRSLESFRSAPQGAHPELRNSTNFNFWRFGSDVAAGVEWTVPDPLPPNRNLSDPDVTASYVVSYSTAAISFYFGSITGDAHDVELMNIEDARTEPGTNDDYEVAVSLDKAVGCLDSLLDLAADLSAERFLRNPIVVRFGPNESGLLSGSDDKGVIWFQFADYVYYNRECVS